MNLPQRLLLILITSITFTSQGQDSNWTYYRGSNLDAVSSNKGLPLTWNENANIVWKIPIPGLGASSPVVYDNQVWITTADSTGKRLFAVCNDLKTGKVIHNIKLFEPDSVSPIHKLNTHATPTPAIEKDFVYIHFGPGTACLESKTGKVIWKREDLKVDYVQGAASSPIIYKDLLILHYEGVDIQFVIALNKKTGTTVWKAVRPQELYVNQPAIARKAYITPIIVNVKGKDLLISNGAEVCIAYDPMTGDEIWRIEYISDTTISMPMFSNGLVIFTTGLMDPIKLMAVKPEGKGNITKRNVVWSMEKDVPAITSPFVKDGLIYMIHERGNLTCLEAETGKIVYANKLKGQFYSAPICADGKIYVTAKNGTIYVLQEGREFRILAENKLEGGEFMATPAVSGKALLIRSSKALYRIEAK